MREILFRGKCTEIGRNYGNWIYGYLGAESDGKMFIAPIKEDGSALIGYFCDPDTISEYTGLTDKNGKKIFEGDILENVSHDEKNFRKIGGKLYGDEVVYKSRGFVYYYEKVGGFCVKYETEEDGVLDENLHQDYLGYAIEIGDGGFLEEFDEDYCIEGTVIIGNIMDNPELLRNPELLEDKP